MTRVLENGQLQWIFEATTEELEIKLEELKKEHAVNLRCHEECLSHAVNLRCHTEFSIALDFLNRASDTLSLMHKISNELTSRIWEDEI